MGFDSWFFYGASQERGTKCGVGAIILKKEVQNVGLVRSLNVHTRNFQIEDVLWLWY
jgi:hypothetical protein